MGVLDRPSDLPPEADPGRTHELLKARDPELRIRALEAITLRPFFDDETTYGLLAGHATADESDEVRAAAAVLLQALYATSPDERILETLRNMAHFDPSLRVKRSAEEALRGLFAVGDIGGRHGRGFGDL
jgi:hypothetical protein